MEFFPRHIYIGATGGVGFYLTMSAIMVSARIYGSLFDEVIAPKKTLLWSSACFFGFLLIIIKYKAKNNRVMTICTLVLLSLMSFYFICFFSNACEYLANDLTFSLPKDPITIVELYAQFSKYQYTLIDLLIYACICLSYKQINKLY